MCRVQLAGHNYLNTSTGQLWLPIFSSFIPVAVLQPDYFSLRLFYTTQEKLWNNLMSTRRYTTSFVLTALSKWEKFNEHYEWMEGKSLFLPINMSWNLSEFCCLHILCCSNSCSSTVKPNKFLIPVSELGGK